MMLVNNSYTQVSTNTTGGVATGIAGTMSYSLGQVVYTSHQGSSGTIALGVQQPFESFALSISETESVSVRVFPNPVNDYLILSVNALQNEPFYYQILDLNGKVIISGEVQNSEATIDLKSINSSFYFLKIMNNENSCVKIFEIVK